MNCDLCGVPITAHEHATLNEDTQELICQRCSAKLAYIMHWWLRGLQFGGVESTGLFRVGRFDVLRLEGRR